MLVPDGADSILIALERRVRGGIAEMEDQVFGKSGVNDDVLGKGMVCTRGEKGKAQPKKQSDTRGVSEALSSGNATDITASDSSND